MKKVKVEELVTKGYKVTNHDGSCSPNGNTITYEVGKTYKIPGKLVICKNGIHFCQKVSNCFGFYSFDPNNKIFEIEAYGEVIHDALEIKSAALKVKIIRELSWSEMLELANTGKGNTGYNNAGDRNAGDRNAGDYNAGDRNAGYGNAGNDNAGVFNTRKAPYIMFDKPANYSYEEFANSYAFTLLHQVNITQWISDYQMSEEEKKLYPYYVTTKGYVKNIPFKEAFQNSWHNWSMDSRKEFEKLPNFDAKIFEEITGVKI